MSTTRLHEFGRSLGMLPEDRTTRDRWKTLLGSEMEAVEPFLNKAGTAAVVWLRGTDGHETSWRVVAHGKTDLVGIDDESGERIDLAFDQAQMHAVEWQRIVEGLHAGLGLTGPSRRLPDTVLTWEVGRRALTDERSVQVFLVGAPRDRMAITLDRLVAGGVVEAVVIVGDTTIINAEAVARLAQRKIVVVGIRDRIAVDARQRLVGIAGPECVVGDLRAALGLAQVSRPAYQFIRSGSRWDIVFRGQDISVSDGHGMHAIAMLLEKPNQPMPAITLQASIHHVERSTLSGSKGPVNDRMTRDEVTTRYKELKERMDRLGSSHPEYDRLETEMEQLATYFSEGDGMRGEDRQVTGAAQVGRAIGNAINRAIGGIAKESDLGKSLAAYLKDTLKDRTGQNPAYRPPEPVTWIIAM